jgi:hypothetical protein
MSRGHGIFITLAIGLIVAIGTFAAVRTSALGGTGGATDALVARRTAELDRYGASLQTALEQATARVNRRRVNAGAPAQMPLQAPVVTVFRRPPPVVVDARGSAHARENEAEGVEPDD